MHVRASGDGVQRPHGHHVLVHRIRAPRRQDRPARRRLGAGALRGEVRAQLPRAEAGLRERDGRLHPPEPDQDAAGGRPRPQEDARPGQPREHPPVQARALGAALGVRPQRHAAAGQEAQAGARAAGRRDRQRARLLLDARADPRRLPRRLPQGPAAALAAGGGAGRRARRRGEVQLPARRRAPPLRALRDQALLHHPQGAVRARHAARRRAGD